MNPQGNEKRRHFILMGCTSSSECPAASCDKSGKPIVYGDWWHRVGAVGEPSYDLCDDEFKKLPPGERSKYVKIGSAHDYRVTCLGAGTRSSKGGDSTDVAASLYHGKVVARGGSRSSKADELSRPAEVPCHKCSATTYFQEREATRKCYRCGEPLDRFAQGARGLESSAEYRDSAAAIRSQTRASLGSERLKGARAWG